MSVDLNLLYPLDEFYKRAGREVPSVEEIDGEDVPEPYNWLLVHENDMTPTLEAFHAERIHLRVLERHLEGDALSRQVVLTSNESGWPVEFGAVVIHLQHFPEAARHEILECWTPLGTIMAIYDIDCASSPQAFIRVQADDVIMEALGLEEACELFGRRNVIEDTDGNVLADIVEILPLAGDHV